jgi:hypothetical protein
LVSVLVALYQSRYCSSSSREYVKTIVAAKRTSTNS